MPQIHISNEASSEFTEQSNIKIDANQTDIELDKLTNKKKEYL